jgi:L-cysteine:1D-myo-inositol 2-amino-2-deoxy-alpha-D-glucopyranoside ligase
MAIRLAILAHHYRHDWDWTAAGLAAAAERLARWRAAAGRLLAASPEPASSPSAVASSPSAVASSPSAVASSPSALASPPGGSVTPPGGPASPPSGVMAAEAVLAGVRGRIADDLDAPGALAVVDRWAEEVIGAPDPPPDPRAAAMLVRDTADAVLGVAL